MLSSEFTEFLFIIGYPIARGIGYLIQLFRLYKKPPAHPNQAERNRRKAENRARRAMLQEMAEEADRTALQAGETLEAGEYWLEEAAERRRIEKHLEATEGRGTYFYVGQFDDERRRAVVDRMKAHIRHETGTRPPRFFSDLDAPAEIPADLKGKYVLKENKNGCVKIVLEVEKDK